MNKIKIVKIIIITSAITTTINKIKIISPLPSKWVKTKIHMKILKIRIKIIITIIKINIIKNKVIIIRNIYNNS
jgi:hypothetical protein